MDHYSFIITFMSIILGVAVARALEGLGWPIKHPSRQSFYLPYLLIGGLLICLIVQYWWGMLDVQNSEDWTFAIFAQHTITPILFYFLADLLVPEETDADLKAHYWQRIRAIYIIAALVMVNNSVSDLITEGDDQSIERHGIRLIAVIVLLGLAWTRNQVLHYIGYALFYTLLAAFIVVSAAW